MEICCPWIVVTPPFYVRIRVGKRFVGISVNDHDIAVFWSVDLMDCVAVYFSLLFSQILPSQSVLIKYVMLEAKVLIIGTKIMCKTLVILFTAVHMILDVCF